MKNKKSMSTIILILIIVALGSYIVYDKFYTNNNTQISNITNTKTSIKEKENGKEKILVKKIDESKDYIYDGEYIGDFSNESYTTQIGNTYYSKDLKAPFFNIDSTDANNSNKEVNETYLNAVRIFNQGINDKTTYINLNYKKYQSNDVLSAVFKYEVGDVGVTNPKNKFINTIGTT